ncbi:hypothetical protein [Ruminococcus sp.]|uniref:hypothetical protein n=1 Tax=Ruminococcus sp. TaxID=41978 RepID=UPI002FD90B13
MHIKINEDYNVVVNTALLGYVGETNARPVSVEGMEIDGADRYVLTIDYGDGVTYEADITGGQWTPTADILRSAQTVSCQIAAKKLSGDEYILVKKSRIFRLRIGAAIGDNAVPSPSVAADALDRISAIGEQVEADVERAENAASTAMQAAENAKKSATAAEKSADTATQAAERAETAKTAAETSATQADTAMQGAETARAEAVKSQNDAKVSAAQAATSAQQTTADKNITAGYAKTAKTNADSTAADRQAVQTLAEQVTADKATVAENAAKVAEDRTAAETAAQTAQAVADSLPEDYTTAVAKIAENTAEIGRIKLTDKELQRRVDALYLIGQGVTHKFETDTDTAYQKAVPTGGKLMSIKSVGGRSLVFNQIVSPNNFRPSYTMNGITFTKVDNVKFVANGTATGGDAYFSGSFVPIKGHVYLEKSCPKGGSATTYRSYLTGSGVVMDTNYGSGVIASINVDTQVYMVPLLIKEGTTVDNLVVYPQMYDLTAMFGSGNEPKTVAEFEAIFPDDYYPYNIGEIISADTESIVEQGVNLYYSTDMLKVGSDDYEYIANSYRCKAIKLKPNTTYTLSFTSDKTSEIILLMNVTTVVNAGQYFDFRKSSHTQTYTTGDDGCLYVGVYAGNGNVASADVVKRLSECEIMISESDVQIAYVPFHQTRYPIPEAIKALPGYGWSAGTARNYADYENKKYVQCVGSVDLGTLDWELNTTSAVGNHFYGYVRPLNFKYLGVFGTTIYNVLCSKYRTVPRSSNVFVDKTITIDGVDVIVSQVQIKDTAYPDVTAFKQAMQGVTLYYELANPIITDISTLIDDDFLRNITVEAGGSVTFKNSNDSYRIPVPSEDEYIVKLSEVGGTT